MTLVIILFSVYLKGYFVMNPESRKRLLLRLSFVICLLFSIFVGYLIAEKYTSSVGVGGLVAAFVTVVLSAIFLFIVRLLGVKTNW